MGSNQPLGHETGGRRAALDGLRALAVLAVLAYHFGGGSLVRGGYLGVDLFFVLSGYLITGLLLDEHTRTGGIDLPRFWARRVRRLLPALTLVVLAVAAWLWWASGPQGWPARRLDLLATLAYVANWHLIDTGQDYFASYSGASPVRHTWSLAIEEQFYLLWPLLILLAVRLRRGPALLGVVVTVASAVAMAALHDPENASRAYYGTDARVHELAVGALLAVALRRAGPVALRTAARLGAPSLAVVAACFVALPDDTSLYYRGGSLMFAVAVAALIAAVETAPDSALARRLSWRPLAYLGLISYGVYLWHWPVQVLLPQPASPVLAIALWTTVTLALAVGSFHLVEQPILRRGLPLVGSRSLPTLIGGTAVAVGSAAVVLVATRLPAPIQEEVAQRADLPCPPAGAEALASCVQARGTSEQPVTMVVGDSTARALVPGLVAQARREDSTVVQAAWQMCTATGLLVLRSEEDAPGPEGERCAAHASAEISEAVSRHPPDLVLVEDFWPHHQRLWLDGHVVEPGTPEHDAALAARYRAIVSDVAAVGGHTVFVAIPPSGASIGPSVAPGRPAGKAQYAYPDTYRPGFNALLDEVADSSPSAAVIDIEDLLCPGGHCAAVQGGHLVRPDGVHLTPARSVQLAPVVLERARQAVGLV